MEKITVIQEQKFKSVYINVRLLQPLVKEKVAGNMILANLLNDVCQKYNTKQAVVNKLDALYGASFSISCNIIGNVQIFVAKTKSIHPKYIHDQEPLVKEQFSLLHEFLCKPLMENDLFNQKWFEEAKRNAIFSIQRIHDDPSALCMFEAMQRAGLDQPLGDSVIIDPKEIERVTLEEVSELYFTMLHESKCDVMVLGDVNKETMETYAKTYLPFKSKHTTQECNYLLSKLNIEALQYGYKDISQSYITSIYTTNVKNDSSEFSALRVANVVFGQIPSSLLFQEVREKNSLCYSIYSALNPYDGALAISTGVDHANVEKTLTLIATQYERMKAGDFDKSLLDSAKKMLVNSLQATYDDVDSIFALTYRNILFNRQETVEEVIANIEAVQKEDVMNVMQKGEYVMSYVVTQKEV